MVADPPRGLGGEALPGRVVHKEPVYLPFRPALREPEACLPDKQACRTLLQRPDAITAQEVVPGIHRHPPPGIGAGEWAADETRGVRSPESGVTVEVTVIDGPKSQAFRADFRKHGCF